MSATKGSYNSKTNSFNQSIKRNDNIILDRVGKKLKIKDEHTRLKTAREINELALLLIELKRLS